MSSHSIYLNCQETGSFKQNVTQLPATFDANIL